MVAKIARSIAEEPGFEPVESGHVTCPVLVMAADDDIVTFEHTLEM